MFSLKGLVSNSPLNNILFLMYTKSIMHIFDRHEVAYQLYADDAQLYFSVDKSTSVETIVTRVKSCLTDVVRWMHVNSLRINPDKTELIIFQPKHTKDQAELSIQINLSDDVVISSRYVRHLGYF